MGNQLSGVAIIICIAFGVLTFILLFIFAKRQIMRFALKSRRGPHAPVGQDASKVIRVEIERRLSTIRDISYEPKLLKKEEEGLFTNPNVPPGSIPQTVYRMKSIDSLFILENDIASHDLTQQRKPGYDLRVYLLRLLNKGVLIGCDPHIVHQFVNLYEHARHEPVEYGIVQFNQYFELLGKLRQCTDAIPIKGHAGSPQYCRYWPAKGPGAMAPPLIRA